MRFVLFTSSLILFSTQAFAASCDWNADKSFYTCDGYGVQESVGRTVATMGEVININPAALPTVPTPVGMEFDLHSRDQGPEKSRSQLSLIKGFNGLGVELGSWTTGTMSSMETGAIFDGSPYAGQYQSYLNQVSVKQGYRLGSAFRFPLGLIGKGYHLQVGGSIGEGPRSSIPSVGYGVTGAILGLNLGYSYLKENLSGLLPQIVSNTFSVGLQEGPLYVGYSATAFSITTPLPSSSMFSVRWANDSWSLFASYKKYGDYYQNSHTWTSASAHLNFGKHLALGYVYGLYPGSHSASSQFYF